jgi:hypothetical protein
MSEPTKGIFFCIDNDGKPVTASFLKSSNTKILIA